MHDLPGGSWRFVVHADGYVALVVNGEMLLACHAGVRQRARRPWRARPLPDAPHGDARTGTLDRPEAPEREVVRVGGIEQRPGDPLGVEGAEPGDRRGPRVEERGETVGDGTEDRQTRVFGGNDPSCRRTVGVELAAVQSV